MNKFDIKTPEEHLLLKVGMKYETIASYLKLRFV